MPSLETEIFFKSTNFKINLIVIFNRKEILIFIYYLLFPQFLDR